MIPHVAAPLVLICKEHVEKVSFERVFAAKTSSGLFVYFTPTLTYTRTHTHARRPEAQEGVVTSPLPHCKLETQIGASPKLLSLAGSTAPLPYLFFFFLPWDISPSGCLPFAPSRQSPETVKDS